MSEETRGLEMTEGLRSAIGAEGPDEGMAPSTKASNTSPAAVRRRSKEDEEEVEEDEEDPGNK